MKLKSIGGLLLACLVVIVCVGCATTSAPQAKFSAATVQEIEKGMTKEQVLGLLGEPKSRSVEATAETWQYRKNAKQGAAVKTFANITSFGLTSGLDAEYQDILTVKFKSDVVDTVLYEENVRTIPSLTGLGRP